MVLRGIFGTTKHEVTEEAGENCKMSSIINLLFIKYY
jgi:hypothetical protein